ncbi:MAG: rod shape-determining protein MreC, partial [Anaerotignum sp.]|nr:rod shape-determining protein MreC [Anaerotignum sp.]
VKGDYTRSADGLCIMEYIDAQAEILVGDEIVTSHLSDIYPAGLAIGKVLELETDTSGLTKYAVIQPYVDLKHLDTILVIDKSSAIEVPVPAEPAMNTETPADEIPADENQETGVSE